MSDEPTITHHSLGDLEKAAHIAAANGEVMVTVNAQALLALCRSEQWAHRQLVEKETP